jgi:hypothetical protein
MDCLSQLVKQTHSEVSQMTERFGCQLIAGLIDRPREVKSVAAHPMTIGEGRSQSAS